MDAKQKRFYKQVAIFLTLPLWLPIMLFWSAADDVLRELEKWHGR